MGYWSNISGTVTTRANNILEIVRSVFPEQGNYTEFSVIKTDNTFIYNISLCFCDYGMTSTIRLENFIERVKYLDNDAVFNLYLTYHWR